MSQSRVAQFGAVLDMAGSGDPFGDDLGGQCRTVNVAQVVLC